MNGKKIDPDQLEERLNNSGRQSMFFQISDEALKRYRVPLKNLIIAANDLDDELVSDHALMLAERIRGKTRKTGRSKRINYSFKVINGGQKFEDQPPFAN